MAKEKIRCTWCTSDPLYVAYHDEEWGVPSKDDRHLFEMINLEGAQAGLSWLTVLKKRENYRKAFDGWDPEVVARYKQKKIEALLSDAGIIRNRLKVNASIENAKAYLQLRDEGQTLSDFLWKYCDGKPIINRWTARQRVPASTPLSDQMSKDLKKRGFRFVGTTICYAFMQAVGIVDDHSLDCWRKKE
jgi:DNA-3-methyladenine glycosylase I